MEKQDEYTVLAKYCTIKGSADRFSLYWTQLITNWTIPRIGVGKQTERILQTQKKNVDRAIDKNTVLGRKLPLGYSLATRNQLQAKLIIKVSPST
jgi:hypothetical protein